MKQFFKFDKHIFPPDSAPFRRGLAIGMSISVTIIVILNMVAWISGYFYFRNVGSPGMAILSGLLVLALGYPWITLWGDSQLDMLVCNLINGAIFGIAMGFIFKATSRKKVFTIVSSR